METQNGTVETADLGLAVYLFSIGSELVYIDRANPRQAVFVFQLAPARRDELTKWQNGTAMVNGPNFWNAYRQVKLALHKSQ